MNIEKIIKEKHGRVIDVRTHEEFMGGHVEESINMPLHDIPHQIGVLKKLNSPLILCCASGIRSRQAFIYLKQHDIECYNGGSWMDVNYFKSQTV